MLHHHHVQQQDLQALSNLDQLLLLGLQGGLEGLQALGGGRVRVHDQGQVLQEGLLSHVDYPGHGEYLQGEHVPKPRLDFLPQFVVGGLVPGQVPVGGHQDHKGWLVRPAMESSQYCEEWL